MPEVIREALAYPGLHWLIAAALVAGLVRGFSGFGTAMVYLPVAGQFLSPFAALTTLIIMDVIGPLPNVPRAIRDGLMRDIALLAIGALIALPVGVWVLTLVAPEVFRYSVSAVSLGLLVLLIGGVRYRGVLKRWMILATGSLGGFLAGSTGLAGPPVIMLYMASSHAAKVVRANLLLYLLGGDFLMLAVLYLNNRLVPEAIVIGAILAVPYMIGNVIGAKIFHPEWEKTYHAVAYTIIAISAINGLPIWDAR